MEKRAKVTRLVLEHMQRATDALENFRESGVSNEGVLVSPITESEDEVLAI